MTEEHQHGGLPKVVDEAGDTPPWVPLVGLALLALVAISVAIDQALSEPEEGADVAAAEGEPGGDEVAEPPEGEPAEGEPAQGEPAQGE